jgi:UDP-3-O-[3-hydroxymyristoyl] glucosamine N-acyltransferase
MVLPLRITGVAGIEEAGSGHAFVANPKYAAAAKTTASAVIMDENFLPSHATLRSRTLNGFLLTVKIFYQPPQ